MTIGTILMIVGSIVLGLALNNMLQSPIWVPLCLIIIFIGEVTSLIHEENMTREISKLKEEVKDKFRNGR